MTKRLREIIGRQIEQTKALEKEKVEYNALALSPVWRAHKEFPTDSTLCCDENPWP